MLNWNNTKVTLELNDLIESGCNPWAFDYPSYYKGAEKEAFEQKVIDHYRFRQIGQETPGRWLHYFRTRMREIMPYYIQLYESEALMKGLEDPFANVDIVETFEQETTGQHSGSLNRATQGTLESGITGSTETQTQDTGKDESNGTKRFSNTPQGSITNIDSYMTEATHESVLVEKTSNSTSDTTSTSTQSDVSTSSQTDATTGTEKGTVKHTFTKKGNQGVNTYAHDMKELRETFLNIDMMIIRELNDLFLMVY